MIPTPILFTAFLFLTAAVPLSVTYGNEPTSTTSAASPQPLVLENDELRAEFSRDTGALVRLVAKRTNWEIHRRAQLGRSFRLLVPVPERRNNPVLGERQPPPEVTHDATRNKITFTWNRLRSEHAGEMEIRFAATVQLTQKGLAFSAQLANHSEHVVETVSWPYLGEIRRPADAERMETLHLYYMMMAKNPVYPVFKSDAGYWGTDHPLQLVHAPRSPFVLIDAEGKQGLYMGYHTASLERMLTFTLGLKPGHARTDFLFLGAAPDTEEIGGQPRCRGDSACSAQSRPY